MPNQTGFFAAYAALAAPQGPQVAPRPVAPVAPVLPVPTGRKQGETGADWTAPFKTPKLTTDEFKKQQAAYVAKYGYTITIPGLDDVFHIKTIPPMTPEEIVAWKRKDWTKFSDARYAELKEHKAKKKARFLAMLGSPSPTILKNAGVILTSIDNAQDALTTLSVLGRLAIKFAPRILGKALLGPVGWIMTAADVLNIAMTLGRMLTMPMMGKRAGEQATADNPFSKSAKIKRATKLMRPWPSVGNMIEVAQTTDNIFGIGLSLGPIVGLMQDIMTGAIRSSLGQKVTVSTGPPHTSPALYAAASVQKATTLIFASGYEPDDELLLEIVTAHYLSLQELHSNSEGWNALDNVQNIQTSQLSVPVPSNILSIEVMEEVDPNHEFYGGWPHHNRQWAVMDDIIGAYSQPGNDFLLWAMAKHNHDWLGHVIGSLLTQSNDYVMGNVEGEDQVNVNYTEQAKFLSQTMRAGIYPDPDQPPEKLKELTDQIEFNDFNGMHQSTTEYIRFMADRKISTLKM